MKRPFRSLLLFTALFCLLFVFSCAQAAEQSAQYASPVSTAQSSSDDGLANEETAGFFARSASDQTVAGTTGEFEAQSPSGGEAGTAPNPTPTPPASNRLIIRTGNLSVEVPGLDAARASIEAAVNGLGGYIESISISEWYGTIVCRIPAERFEEFLGAAQDLGRVLSLNVNASDVTLQYFDLQGRIQNKRILQERYQAYLARAADVEDLLAIERSLNDLQYEIESLEGTFRDLARQIEYSTLSVQIQLPASQADTGFTPPNMSVGFREFGRNVVNFFYGFFFVLVYIVAFGIPIALVLGLLYLLLFGKVGLLRKYFAKLRANKKKE